MAGPDLPNPWRRLPRAAERKPRARPSPWPSRLGGLRDPGERRDGGPAPDPDRQPRGRGTGPDRGAGARHPRHGGAPCGSRAGSLRPWSIDLERGRAAREVTPATLRRRSGRSGELDRARSRARTSPDSASGPTTRRSTCCARATRCRSCCCRSAARAITGGSTRCWRSAAATWTPSRALPSRASPKRRASARGSRSRRGWRSFPAPGTRDEAATMRFRVARGHASSDYEVDGITGATRTSNAMHADGPLLAGPRRLRPVPRRGPAGGVLSHGASAPASGDPHRPADPRRTR